MARLIEPVCRICRREGVKLYLKGMRCYTPKCEIERRNTPPGAHGKTRTRLSDYGVQLREKQKMKRIYGVFERQFRVAFGRAQAKRGVTGETLIQLMERRLDNTVMRLLFAVSRQEARQFVRHGHIFVNGRTVRVPSFTVRVGDAVSVRPKERIQKLVRQNLEMLKDRVIPGWLASDPEALTAKVLRLPQKEEAGLPVDEQQIVELYSK